MDAPSHTPSTSGPPVEDRLPPEARNPTSDHPLLRSLDRGVAILRYYGKRQLARRAAKVGLRRLMGLVGVRPRLRLAGTGLPLRQSNRFALIAERRLAWRGSAGAPRRAAEILAGEFNLLNQRIALPDPVDWRLASQSEVPHLWHFQLHYQEYLLDLISEFTSTADRRFLERAWNLAEQWIDGNPPEDSAAFRSAWHPYCISRRAPVWICLLSQAPPGADLAGKVRGSLAQQIDFLARNLETDLRGNHLLENLRALALAGVFFDGPVADRWLSTSSRLLRKEIPRQLLAHGEHFERSPMYHTHVLTLLSEVAIAVHGTDEPLHEACLAGADRMAAFLRSIVHPDGKIPLLGDSCFGEAAPAAHVLSDQTADAEGHFSGRAPAGDGPARAIGGYWTFRDGDDFLLFDAGPVGPKTLPGHAHCDLLGLEASLFGKRLFVDSGVFDYADSPMRAFCRSTAAHNVIEVDGRNQCDVWSSFRMGYRGWPGVFEQGRRADFHWAAADHNAFRRAGVRTVGRWIACRSGGPWIGADWAEGRGEHAFAGRWHLHPDAAVEVVAVDEVTIRHAGKTLRLTFFGNGTLAIEPSWYSPAFGVRLENQAVVWRTEGKRALFVWSLNWGEEVGRVAMSSNATGGSQVIWRPTATPEADADSVVLFER